MALNRLGLGLASVGNHEFDRGTVELRRMQQGGCDKNTLREPCQLDRPFEGAKFTYLAANVLDAQGETLFPGTAMREFGGVKVGFIGMTLKETGILVSPAGTAGYRFADEAETANALAAKLRAEGADAVVLLIHQGADVDPIYNTGECPELSGDILPILDRLDPAIRLVVSGHTHQAYICQRPASDGSMRTLTSAGRYGYFVTDIRMTVDPATDQVLSITAANTPGRRGRRRAAGHRRDRPPLRRSDRAGRRARRRQARRLARMGGPRHRFPARQPDRRRPARRHARRGQRRRDDRVHQLGRRAHALRARRPTAR